MIQISGSVACVRANQSQLTERIIMLPFHFGRSLRLAVPSASCRLLTRLEGQAQHDEGVCRRRRSAMMMAMMVWCRLRVVYFLCMTPHLPCHAIPGRARHFFMFSHSLANFWLVCSFGRTNVNPTASSCTRLSRELRCHLGDCRRDL